MTTVVSKKPLVEVFGGLLVGTAVGDALGLPAENLSPARIARLWHGAWRMRLFFGRGMISDDTEHTLMIAQALLSEPNDAVAFQRSFAWKLRWWFAALPGAVGLATARACIKLWLGFPAQKAAVRSGGAGPAMRSAIIGAYFVDDAQRRRDFVLASSRQTHRGWQAEVAALAIAECAAIAARSDAFEGRAIVEALRELSTESEWLKILSLIEQSLEKRLTVRQFVEALGLSNGVSGYALHVAPVAIFAWLRHAGDFRSAVTSVLDCGGDTDTVGAIVGAVAGASVGRAGIPSEWTNAICDWPRSVQFMDAVASKLAEQRASTKISGPAQYFWPAVIPRNVAFLAIVLFHGFRRLLPPY